MLDELRSRTEPTLQLLQQHPIYREVTTPPALRVFMEHHVWAVWDFMSLAKRLQRVFTCCDLPWIPPARPDLARMVNEVIRDEESDLDCTGQPASHFQSYLVAMTTVGASTSPIEGFIAMLQDGVDWRTALSRANVPAEASRFVAANLELAENGEAGQVAAAFAFGRELALPKLFSLFLSSLEEVDKTDARWEPLKYYLERHVELDGDHHGEVAEQMVVHAVEQEGRGWEKAIQAAMDSLQARLRLWDATHQAILESG